MLFAFFCGLAVSCGSPTIRKKPNVIVILIDDLGYGDFGCYGNVVNKTPAIDSLAQYGMLFTDYHANGPMCTPTRASLLTGLYPQRLGDYFESALDDVAHQDVGLPLEVPTLPGLLREFWGYKTAIMGKWHLGYQSPYLPTSYGFDRFKGLLAGDGDHHTHVNRSGVEDWWHDEQPVREKGYSVDLITKHSIDFIRENKSSPFFLYISHLAIHFPWQGPDDPGHRVAGIDYRQQKWGIIPNRRDVSLHVKAMVEAIDSSVGQVVATLRELGLEKNTLIVVTSDNGGYINYPDSDGAFEHISSNGRFKGQKGQLYEGGHRVAFIAYWPDKIPQGTANNSLVMSMDLVPTLLAVTGIGSPDGVSFDGLDVSQTLFNNQQVPDRTVFWKRGKQFAVRNGAWKLIQAREGEPELYDLDRDSEERHDLAGLQSSKVRDFVNQYEIWREGVNASAKEWTDVKLEIE